VCNVQFSFVQHSKRVYTPRFSLDGSVCASAAGDGGAGVYHCMRYSTQHLESKSCI